MPIVGGFLGGGVEMVPAGKMQVCLQWNTEDRENISGAVFTLTGTEGTYTANGDASGRAEIVVPAGTYTVSVTHSGTYSNDSPQTVRGVSTQSYLVLFDAYNRSTAVEFSGPACPSATFMIKDPGETTIASGSGWNSIMSMAISAGTYTLSVTAFGVTSSMSFTAIGGTTTKIGTDSLFSTITVKGVSSSTTVKIDSAIARTGNGSIIVPRANTSVTLNATFPTLNGSNIANASSIPTNVSGDSTVTFSSVGTQIMLTTSKTIIIPDGEYKVFAIGGGGAGDTAGGGGGYVTYGTYRLSGATAITIGQGGSNGNGGVTSIGSIVSAAGGSSGKNGGNGGSGGGGVMFDFSSYPPGNGQFGGGGGGVWSYEGGAGGTHGGAGGSNGANGEAGTPGDGKFFGAGPAEGGSGSKNGSKICGGGGGGYGAKGGSGYAISSYYIGGGGGGYNGGAGGGRSTIERFTFAKGYGAGGQIINGGGGGGGYGSSVSPNSASGMPGCVVFQWVSE